MPTINDIKLTQKWKDILNDKSKVVFLEGVSGSGKSLLSAFKLYYDVMHLPKGQNSGIIMGESITTLEKNFINISFSLCNLFPNVIYKQHGIGGSRFEIQTRDETKYIYLAGYSNKTSQEKILGGTYHYFFLDEGNKAHPDFIAELFNRLGRDGGNLTVTSNGDDPDLKFYTHFMDQCEPVAKYRDQIPIENLEYIDRVESLPGWSYYFFDHYDNPTKSKKEIDAWGRSFKDKQSYAYLTKFKGVRAVQQGAIYANIMDISMITDDPFKFKYKEFTIGIDVGATNYTVFTFCGFTYKNEVVVIDMTKINESDIDKIWQNFCKWYEPIQRQYYGRVKAMLIDSSAKITRLSLDRKARQKYGLQVVNAYKFSIDQRIRLEEHLMNSNKFYFTYKTEEAYKAFRKMVYSDKKSEIRLDNGEVHNDIVDSIEYAMSIFQGELSK